MIASETIWQPAPQRLTLKNEEVHVWRTNLNQTAATISAYTRILSPDERSRAIKYHFRKDGERFISARATLRMILSLYLSVEPERLRFDFNAYGKPALAAETSSDALRFNLSHAGDLALYAIAQGRGVGVDLEEIRGELDTAKLARRFFTPGEVVALEALPLDLQTEGFFRCWTRKEAYIKARGEGLSLPLDQFTVSLSPAEPARLLDVTNDPAEVSRWSLMELSPAQGYIAALAAEGQDWQPYCYQWPDGA